MSAGKTILELDDYSLRHVFSFLSVSEMATAGYACFRFRSIIGPLIGKNGIKLGSWISPWEHGNKEFYANYGTYFTKIYIHGRIADGEHFDLVPRYCHNIESAKIALFGLVNFEFVEKLFASNENIRSLHLHFLDIGFIPGEFISVLQNLETLHLTYAYGFTGEHLSRLTNLKELDLLLCRKLNSNHFIGICKANKLLKLNIIGCVELNTEAFGILVETQTELKEILVDDWYESGEVAQIALLTNLRRIHINFKDNLKENTKNLLSELSEYHASSLKRLTITGWGRRPSYNDLERIRNFNSLEELAIIQVSNLEDSNLTRVSKACELLQRVEIRDCRQISSDGILQLIRNLKYLSELKLGSCPSVGGELYQEICDAKRTLDTKIKLKVHVNQQHILRNVTDEQYKMNQSIVQLFYNSKPFNVRDWEYDLSGRDWEYDLYYLDDSGSDYLDFDSSDD